MRKRMIVLIIPAFLLAASCVVSPEQAHAIRENAPSGAGGVAEIVTGGNKIAGGIVQGLVTLLLPLFLYEKKGAVKNG